MYNQSANPKQKSRFFERVPHECKKKVCALEIDQRCTVKKEKTAVVLTDMINRDFPPNTFC